MPQDAFTIKFVSRELNAALAGGKISKIVQPEKDLLTLIIYTERGTVKLEICLTAKRCRLSLSKTETPAPKTAPNFCMLLRKHLQNAKILAVEQVGDERIVRFDFECTSEFELSNMQLYAELMGKYSNAVLVKDGIIVGALKTTSIGESTRRVLFTGAKYCLPEPQDKLSPLDLAGLEEAFKTPSADRAKFISERVRGVAYSTALEIVAEYGNDVTAKQVYVYLNSDKASPCVTFENGEESDFKVRSVSSDKISYPTVLEAQTAFYDSVTAKSAFLNEKKRLLSAVESAERKLEKRLAVIEQKLLDCGNMETVKLKGELITANIYAVKRGMKSFEAVNYYDENQGKITIALDETLSPADNAQRYFKKYAKLKRTVAAVTGQKKEARAELDYLNSIISSICAGERLKDFEETEEELRLYGLLPAVKNEKKKQKSSPFRSYNCNGFKILAGRNNLQNDRLLKSVSPRDMWLHTQNYHSSHVVIVADGRDIPDAVIKTASEICAYYSDGRGGAKVPVDYTRRQFVKKPPKSNAGFVIYTDYKTALAQPDAHRELSEDENER